MDEKAYKWVVLGLRAREECSDTSCVGRSGQHAGFKGLRVSHAAYHVSRAFDETGLVEAVDAFAERPISTTSRVTLLAAMRRATEKEG